MLQQQQSSISINESLTPPGNESLTPLGDGDAGGQGGPVGPNLPWWRRGRGRRWAQQNQAARSRGPARCLWDVLKRRDFPVLDSSGRAPTVPCGDEDGSWRKKCNFQDQRTAVRLILNGTRKSKMEILDTRSGLI